MPFKLYPPRKGKSPYWTVRGTYLETYLERSTKTPKRAVAQKLLTKWEGEIERGEFVRDGEPLFSETAIAYKLAGGEKRYLAQLIAHFKDKPLRMIDQAAIDAAALVLKPGESPATRNRSVYTPMSAILKYAGIQLPLKRPKGAGGNKLTNWLWPEEAERLFDAGFKLDAEFGTLLVTLCYTGMRITEALTLEVRNVRLAESFAYITTSKNDDPRPIFLPPVVVQALASHPRGLDREGTVFRFKKSGHLYSLLRAAAAHAEVDLPEHSAFHIFCHTWATWMRRFAGMDAKGLVATGRWRDPKSAERYEHVVVSEEARKAVLLPVGKRRA